MGVLPPDFTLVEAFATPDALPEFWVPLQAGAGSSTRYERGRGRLWGLARLAEGVDVEYAREEAREIARELATLYPETNTLADGAHRGIGVNALHAQTVGQASGSLRIFLGAATLLLLLACMNAATLLLARALDRTRELGVRMALGSGRRGVVRLLLTEACLLAAGGGLVGVGLAYGGVALFLRYAPRGLPRLDAVTVDARVLVVAAAVTLGVGLLAGLLPALRLTGHRAQERLQGLGRSAAERPSRLRSALVSGQVAVAVVLLSGAALLFTSFVRVRTMDPGFRADGVASMAVSVKGAPGVTTQMLSETPWVPWDMLLDEVEEVPGLDAFAAATAVPFEAPRWAPRILLPGDGPDVFRDGIAGYLVTPGYFEVIGTRLLRGRALDAGDGPDAERVAVVNEEFVRTQLRNRPAVGAMVHWIEGDQEAELRIVGVVENAVQARVEDGPGASIYMPYTQGPPTPVRVVARSTLPAEVVLPAMRAAAGRFNPRVPVIDIGSMDDRVSATHVTPRFQAMLISAFAIIALLLAALGLYGALTHQVGRRARELGVRMALGAERARVLRMVLRQGMRIVVVGLGVGVVVTLLGSRVLAGLLYGVEPNDPATLMAVVAALGLVAAAASFGPARRATAVDPVRVLNSE